MWVPLPHQIIAMGGLKIFVALLFGFLLIRREGVGEGAALFGSAVFALSIFISVYLYYPLASTAVLVPAAAWAVLHCIDRPRFGSLVAVALVIGGLQSAGHPETVFHAAVVVAFLLLIELIAPAGARPGRAATLRGLGVALAGVTAGMLVSAPAWLPVLEQVLESQRVHEIGAGGFGGGVYPRNLLWIFFNPTGYGHPVRDTWSWIGIYPMVASSYLGLLTLSLLPAGLFSKHSTWRDRLFVTAGVMLTIIAINWTMVGHLFVELFPWIAHDRLRFGATLLFGIVAARVAGRMASEEEWILPAAGGVLALSGALYVMVHQWGVTIEPRDTVGVIALVGFWIAVIAVRSRFSAERRSLIGWAAFVVMVVELTVFGTEYNPPVPETLYRPELPIVKALEDAAPDEPFRIVGRDWMFLPNSAAQYGLEDVRGSDPMAWGPYTKFLETFDVDDEATDIQRISDLRAPQLDFLNVEFALAEPGWDGASSGWSRIYDGHDGSLWRNEEALPRAYTPERVEYVRESEVWLALEAVESFRKRIVVTGETRRIVTNDVVDSFWIGRMSPTSYRLRIPPSESGRFIATSLTAVRGWKVSSGGRNLPVELVNGAFIGFRLPAGAEVVRIRYRPDIWLWSLGLFACGAFFLMVVWWRWNALFFVENPRKYSPSGIHPHGSGLDGFAARNNSSCGAPEKRQSLEISSTGNPLSFFASRRSPVP